uniref:Uncharacterized protein n=1 Tax=Anguilla anguilla TaxID=7936 RepID=A0A0E9Q824_ANGAN
MTRSSLRTLLVSRSVSVSRLCVEGPCCTM